MNAAPSLRLEWTTASAEESEVGVAAQPSLGDRGEAFSVWRFLNRHLTKDLA